MESPPLATEYTLYKPKWASINLTQDKLLFESVKVPDGLGGILE